MSYRIYIIVTLLIALVLACESHDKMQVFPKGIQTVVKDDQRIDIYINQLNNESSELRENAIKSLINIANESKLSRSSVVSKLINRFDIFRSNKNQTILREDKEELSAYLKLFLELDAIESLDVMVKYINSREQVSSMTTLIGRTISQFGEDAIPSLKKGLTNSDDGIRCRCALTLGSLKFKHNRELGIRDAIETLEDAKESEIDTSVANCIDQSVLTLNQRKLSKYPLEDY